MSTVYTNGELRFFRLTKGVVDYSTEALRIVFKEEWDYLYPATPWRNSSTNGQQLLKQERAKGSRLYDPTYCMEYKPIKDHLSNGDVKEWDVTTLVFALKYSHALSPSRLSHRGRIIGNAIYRLKKVRNYVTAHASKASISRSYFYTNFQTLSQAVGDMLTSSHPLVEKINSLENESEFQTEDLVRYKELTKAEHDKLLSLENDLERLENKMKIEPIPEDDESSTDKAKGGRSRKKSGNIEIISRLQTRVARIESRVPKTCVDLVPSRSRPEIFYNKKYIKMINKSNFLSFNFRWGDLDTFLEGFSSKGDVDMEIFAGIQRAASLSHRSKKKEALEVLNGLIPKALVANNGVVIHARIKNRRAYLLHDLGNDDDAMRDVDEAEQMLSLGECYEDTAEINNAKANIILSSKQDNKADRQQILQHLDKSIKSCEKATVDKSNTIVQVTLRKALVHLGFYQHGILEEVPSSDVDIAKTVLSRIGEQTEAMSKRSEIYYTLSQSLLAYRRGETNRALKLEHKARKKCKEQNLTNEIQQLDLLKDLVRREPFDSD